MSQPYRCPYCHTFGLKCPWCGGWMNRRGFYRYKGQKRQRYSCRVCHKTLTQKKEEEVKND